MKEREELLLSYGRRSSEAKRQSKQDLFGVQNSLKAMTGRLAGLREPALIAGKRAQERVLRDRVAADAAKNAVYGPAWDKIAHSFDADRRNDIPARFLETGAAFYSRLFTIARTIVRLVDEDPKPNAERLREFGDAGRASLERTLYSPAPIYPEYEEAKLSWSLGYWRRIMGESDPTLVRVLAGRTPEKAAEELVRGSKLTDVAFRKELVTGGSQAVASSYVSMILLARDVYAVARAVRKITEDEVEGVQTTQYALIARALFDDQGTSNYPDATFTLRLAFGVVKGFAPEGKPVPPYTTIGGAFGHATAHGNVEPYELPRTWIESRDAGRVGLDIPLNFVTTSDTIGGNSGSPVIDRAGAVIGLNFDRNRYGLARDFGYDDRLGRNIAVDVRGITEALRSIYKADTLLAELRGNRLGW